MKTPTETEDLVQRVCNLYKVHGCEDELPAQEDLVAKLEKVSPTVYEATKIVLNREQLYPISEQQARDLVKIPLTERIKTLYAFTLIGADNYAYQKSEENQEQDRMSWVQLIYGGLRALPSAFKEAIKELDPQELMENHNQHAREYFERAKRNFNHYLLKS